MTKEHKHKTNGSPVDNDALNQEEEKLFDFDKSSKLDAEDTIDQDENSPIEKMVELQASVNELKDKHLRLLAEFDNYKKRTMRERLDLLNSASRDVISNLLPVLDDFDRAKRSAEDPSTDEAFSEGVSLVYNRLYNILQNLGLKAMNSNGELFDPELHEAITEIPAPNDQLKGKVIDTLENGYILNDKIIRHAKVVVGN